MPWDRTTKGESYCPGLEGLNRRHFVLENNDSREVILSWDRTTTEETFCSGIEQLQRNHSVLG